MRGAAPQPEGCGITGLSNPLPADAAPFQGAVQPYARRACAPREGPRITRRVSDERVLRG